MPDFGRARECFRMRARSERSISSLRSGDGILRDTNWVSNSWNSVPISLQNRSIHFDLFSVSSILHGVNINRQKRRGQILYKDRRQARSKTGSSNENIITARSKECLFCIEGWYGGMRRADNRNRFVVSLKITIWKSQREHSRRSTEAPTKFQWARLELLQAEI